MPKSLADGHTKFTLCTTEPADPLNPTAVELNAGLDYSCNVLSSDFTWTPSDSDKVQEKALCDENNANSLGPSNFSAGFTVFRMFDATTGLPDPTEDAKFEAVKVKGTRVWGYTRKSGKKATAAWAPGDEVELFQEIITDRPQTPSDAGGYIKYRVPAEPQTGEQFLTVG
jgi:hypothetical protein